MAQTGDETSRIAEWLYTTLTGDAALVAHATGGVHDSIAPLASGYPRVVFEYLAGADVRNQGPDRIMVETVWLVKCIAEAPSYAECKTGFDRIDAVLEGQPDAATVAIASVDGVDVLTCTREAVVRLPETVDAVEYRHLGGRYRIRAQVTI